jgi:hypothetical protein
MTFGCVELSEIEKNDFNLNISRYVSAAKPEEVIDLVEVNCFYSIDISIYKSYCDEYQDREQGLRYKHSLDLLIALPGQGLKNHQVGKNWILLIIPIYAKVSLNNLRYS